MAHARRMMQGLELLNIDESVADQAGEVDPVTLRSLDALHVASAEAVRDEITALVTYDRRMAEAAIASGFVVESPGA